MKLNFFIYLILPSVLLISGSALGATDGAVLPAQNENVDSALNRRVELEWAPVKNADQYELEVASDPTFAVRLYQKRMTDLKFTVDLQPGTYYYRVRALDQAGFPGDWTATQSLSMNARPPKLTFPVDQTVLRGNLPDTGLPMLWTSSGSGIRYLLEIKAQDETGALTRTVVRQEVDQQNFTFFPQEVGNYLWSVSTLGSGGEEAGMSWTFEIEGVPARKNRSGVPKRIVRYVSPWWKGHWTLYSRYGQSSFSYSVVDQDLRGAGNFSGITGYLTETLNWEWHDPLAILAGGIPWIEGEFEFDRQTVLGESILLPRHAVRVGAWFDEWLDLWRFSPVLELGDQELAIYQPRSTLEAARSNTVLKRLGLGLAAEYEWRTSFVFGGQAKLMMEGGGQGGLTTVSGSGDQLDTTRRAGALNSARGLELQAYATMNLGARIKLQGRARYETHGGSWTPVFITSPSAAAPDGLSSFSTSYLNFDVSLGLRF